MCSAPKITPQPPPPPPPPAPTPYTPQVAADPQAQQMRQLAARLGTNQLVIPMRAVNPL